MHKPSKFKVSGAAFAAAVLIAGQGWAAAKLDCSPATSKSDASGGTQVKPINTRRTKRVIAPVMTAPSLISPGIF